jgi:hypothetical protein
VKPGAARDQGDAKFLQAGQIRGDPQSLGNPAILDRTEVIRPLIRERQPVAAAPTIDR